MKNFIITTFCVAAFLLAVSSCKKDPTGSTNSNNTATLEGQVLTDFSNDLVNPNYQDIQAKANIMLTAINALNVNTTDANLACCTAQPGKIPVQHGNHAKGFYSARLRIIITTRIWTIGR